MKMFFGCAAVSALAAVPAGADLTLLSGVQNAAGEVWAASGFDHVSDSYQLAADDPLASWTPPDQEIGVVLNPDLSARLRSGFASTVTPQEITFSTDVAEAYAMSSHAPIGHSGYEYTHTVEIRFSVSEPTAVRVDASAYADSLTGWAYEGDVGMSFGRDGDQPIFSWVRNAPWQWSEMLPATELVLQPGTYTVAALANGEWSGGGTGSIVSGLSFSLRVIPAPATAGPLAFVLLLARRRR